MSDYLTKILENAERFVTPISAAAPSGTDVAYDVEFEAIKSEIDKLTSVSGGTPAWREVVEKSTPILVERSRDLRLLVWSTVGRLQTKSVDGLAEGLAILHRVTSTQWDTMFPPAKRAKARANLIDWMNDQAIAVIPGIDVTLSNGDAFRAIQSLYDDIDSTLSERLGDAYGGLGMLRSMLRDKVRAIPAPVVEPTFEPSPTSSTTVASPAGAASPAATQMTVASPPTPVASPSLPPIPNVTSANIGPALTSLGEGLFAVARHVRLADPANPNAYRLSRLGLWLGTTEAPPADGGQTRIRPPGDDVRKQLDVKVSSGHWMDLLNAAEDLTEQYLFWLDLHRYVGLAMDRLGALFVEPKKVLIAEIAAFLRRIPSIPTLTFSDGTPFADPGTQAWLDEAIAASSGDATGAGAKGRTNEEDDEMVRRFAEAKELILGGKFSEGIGLAAQLAPRAADERRRFRGRLLVAELAVLGGKPEIGRPILERLVKEMDQRKLENWEPELCAHVLGALASVYRLTGASVDTEASQSVLDRLCRLDPVTAAKWSGS